MRLREFDRPDKAINREKYRDGGRQSWKITDLIGVSPRPGDNSRGLLRYVVDKLNSIPSLNQPGIYIWDHDDYGIFYVGLNNVNLDPNGRREKGLGQRWPAHIDKMLNRLRVEAGRTKAWHRLSDVIAIHSRDNIDLVNKDLEKIGITYIPFSGDKDQLKAREHRLIHWLNPYANVERHNSQNTTRNSSTRVTPLAR